MTGAERWAMIENLVKIVNTAEHTQRNLQRNGRKQASMYEAAILKAGSKAIPTARRTVTLRRRGPTTWNGAPPNWFARRETCGTCATRSVMPFSQALNRGWESRRSDTINIIHS